MTSAVPIASFVVGCADRSGSMMSYGKSGVAAQFYEQLRMLWETANDNLVPTYFTLATFDSQFELFLDNYRLDGVEEKDLPTIDDFQVAMTPRACTRLYDSALECLEMLETRGNNYRKALPNSLKCLDPPIALNFVLLTDGHDNASNPESLDKMNEKMKQLSKNPMFNKIFLGANINAATVGASMGFEKATTIQMGTDFESASVCMRAVSNSLARATTGDDTQVQLPSDYQVQSPPQMPGVYGVAPPPIFRS